MTADVHSVVDLSDDGTRSPMAFGVQRLDQCGRSADDIFIVVDIFFDPTVGRENIFDGVDNLDDVRADAQCRGDHGADGVSER